MTSQEHNSKIYLHQFTTVSADLFPKYDESLLPKPFDNTTVHSGRVQQRGDFVEKTTRRGHDVCYEAISAVIINHIAANNSYYFEPNAITLRGTSYSMSLTPEIPYLLRGNKIVFAKLPGQYAHNESWESMIDWDTVNARSDKRVVTDDLEMHSRLLEKVEAFYSRFLTDVQKAGIELYDHGLGFKQVVLKVDEGLRHIFIGVVDFE